MGIVMILSDILPNGK